MSKETIEAVARMLAAAYWRGRLDNMRASIHEQHVIEAMVKAASEADIDRWKHSAGVALIFK